MNCSCSGGGLQRASGTGFPAQIMLVLCPPALGAGWRTKENRGESAGGMFFFCPSGLVGRGTHPAPGRWPWRGTAAVCHLPGAVGCTSHPVRLGSRSGGEGRVSLHRRFVSWNVPQETGSWALECANRTDDVPTVRVIFLLSCP